MTPAELRSIGEQVYGYGWQGRLAERLEVADRTVRRWLAGTSPIPDRIAEQVRDLVRIAPPPAGSTWEEDRDEAARKALGPHFADLANRAVEVGWHPAEIAAAWLNWWLTVVSDHAGHDIARNMLREAIGEVDADERGER